MRALDGVFLLLAAMLVGLGAAVVRTQGEGAELNPEALHLLAPPPLFFAGSVNEMTVLLVGADDREDRGRSDSIILAYVNPRARRVALMSIPRDTRAEIPGHGRTKINHSYRYGGVPLLKRSVEGLLGERIDRHIKLDFKTFREVVDILGGVKVRVEDVEGHGRGMNYDDNADGLHCHLKPGEQVLDGEAALGFVRYRSDSDTERAARQQQFVKAMIQQHLRPTELPRLLKAAKLILKRVDTNISGGEATRLMLAMRKMTPDSIMTATLPVEPAPAHGVYYAKVNETEAATVRQKLADFVHGPPAKQLPLKECAVAVLNGSGTKGVASRAADLIRETGATVTAIQNADRFDHKRTEVRFHSDAEVAAKQLPGALGLKQAELVEDDDFAAAGAAGIVVTVGKDFAAGGKGVDG